MSIRTKLALWLLITTSVLLLVSRFFIYEFFNNRIHDEYYRSLKNKGIMMASMMSKLTEEELNRPSPDQPGVSPVIPVQENVEIFNNDNIRIFSLQNEASTMPVNLLQRIRTENEVRFTQGKYDILGFKYQLSNRHELVVIVKSIFTSRELKSLKEILVITFFIILLLAAFSTYLLVNVMLAPIKSISSDLADIEGHDVHKRLAVEATGDEITSVRLQINKLLSRIEDSFVSQRSFLSNLAHEVKNPVAAIISEIEVSLTRQRNTDEYKAILSQIRDEALEISDKTSQLTELSRISMAGNTISFSDVRMDEVLWQAKARLISKNKSCKLRFHTDDFPEDFDSLVVSGNEGLLNIALFNLIENACKYSPDHTADIRLYTDDRHRVCIEIRDNAPVIAIEERQKLFEPFYRGIAPVMAGGTGIGLTLVGQIVNVHQFELVISSHEKGNIFTLFCPLKVKN
jgi:signal transduction histidine kinase